MLIISQTDFVYARKETVAKTNMKFFVDHIEPVMIKRVKMPIYAILLKATQTLGDSSIFLQMFLNAEIAEDIPYLEDHVLNEARVRSKEDVHEYVSSTLNGIKAENTYCCDFDLHLDYDDPRYYNCTAISAIADKNGDHAEITLSFTKINFLLTSLFLYQITAREEFIHIFTDSNFKESEFIPIKSFIRNASCVVTIGNKKKVFTHYDAYIGLRKFGFSSVDTFNESKELDNEISEKKWKFLYGKDPIISNILFDERIIDNKAVEVVDILYPIISEVKDKDGKSTTIMKPFKVLQIVSNMIKKQSNFIDPNVIYKKNN